VALAPKAGFKVLKGEPKRYARTGGSGAEVAQVFCGDCGTPLWSEAALPFLPVKAGSLDDPSILEPAIHLWTSEAQPWHRIEPGRHGLPGKSAAEDCMARYDFASDNVAGAMPEVIEAIVAANAGTASGYGTDHVSAAAADRIRALLDADAEVRFTASGTAANAFALTCLAQPHEAVLAHEHAHICTDETGAPASSARAWA
jgi:hypothetical protein